MEVMATKNVAAITVKLYVMLNTVFILMKVRDKCCVSECNVHTKSLTVTSIMALLNLSD